MENLFDISLPILDMENNTSNNIICTPHIMTNIVTHKLYLITLKKTLNNIYFQNFDFILEDKNPRKLIDRSMFSLTENFDYILSCQLNGIYKYKNTVSIDCNKCIKYYIPYNQKLEEEYDRIVNFDGDIFFYIEFGLPPTKMKCVSYELIIKLIDQYNSLNITTIPILFKKRQKLPNQTGIRPISGPICGNFPIFITSEKFNFQSKVFFNGMEMNTYYCSQNNELVFFSPSFQKGQTVIVLVKNSNKIVFKSEFLFIE